MSILWEAILNENFVFSFKNNEEVRVYSRLDETFSNICDDFKDLSLQCQSYCQNVILPIRDIKLLKNEESNLLIKIHTELQIKCQHLQEQLKEYFDSHDDKEILVQWRGRYLVLLDDLCKVEQSKLKQMLERNVALKSTQFLTTDKADLFCCETITDELLTIANQLRGSSYVALDREQLAKYFTEEWRILLQRFESSSEETDSPRIVLKYFSDELFECFKSHTSLLNNELQMNPLNNLANITFESHSLRITKNDLDCHILEKWSINEIDQFVNKCFQQATYECDSTYKSIIAYMESCVGKDFLPGQVSQIIKIMRTLFHPSEMNRRQNRFLLHARICNKAYSRNM